MAHLEEITRQLVHLGPFQREQVLRFIRELNGSRSGESGFALQRFSGSLDATSAREIRAAIEQDCEHTDLAQW